MDLIGKTGIAELKVTDAVTAKTMRSGELDVLATPALIALAEQSAWTSVAPYLEVGQGTVGTKMEFSHTSATPVGMTVRCKTEVVSVEGRRIVFSIQAFDDAGEIGTGRHERFIIDNHRFISKANGKK